MTRPAIETLMMGYFHQDFNEVHGGMWETVDHFVADSGSNGRSVIDEISELLDRYPTDDLMDAYLDSLGCMYRFEEHPGGSREWLREIARHVQARLAEQN